MQKFLLAFVLMLSASLFSCSDNYSTNPTKVGSKNTGKIFTSSETDYINCIEIENSINPYNYVGRIHNQLVYHFLTTNTKPISQVTKSDILLSFQSYLANAYPETVLDSSANDTISNYFSSYIQNVSYLDSVDKTLSLSQKFNILEYNSTQQTYLYSLFTIVNDTSVTIDSSLSLMGLFESTVVSDNSLSQTQKCHILVAASLAKHSLRLWSKAYVFDDENSAIKHSYSKSHHSILDITAKEREKRIREIANADLDGVWSGMGWGALGGAYALGITGTALLPGLGTGAGLAVGAVIGALSGGVTGMAKASVEKVMTNALKGIFLMMVQADFLHLYKKFSL